MRVSRIRAVLLLTLASVSRAAYSSPIQSLSGEIIPGVPYDDYPVAVHVWNFAQRAKLDVNITAHDVWSAFHAWALPLQLSMPEEGTGWLWNLARAQLWHTLRFSSKQLAQARPFIRHFAAAAAGRTGRRLVIMHIGAHTGRAYCSDPLVGNDRGGFSGFLRVLFQGGEQSEATKRAVESVVGQPLPPILLLVEPNPRLLPELRANHESHAATAGYHFGIVPAAVCEPERAGTNATLVMPAPMFAGGAAMQVDQRADAVRSALSVAAVTFTREVVRATAAGGLPAALARSPPPPDAMSPIDHLRQPPMPDRSTEPLTSFISTHSFEELLKFSGVAPGIAGATISSAFYRLPLDEVDLAEHGSLSHLGVPGLASIRAIYGNGSVDAENAIRKDSASMSSRAPDGSAPDDVTVSLLQDASVAEKALASPLMTVSVPCLSMEQLLDDGERMTASIIAATGSGAAAGASSGGNPSFGEAGQRWENLGSGADEATADEQCDGDGSSGASAEGQEGDSLPGGLLLISSAGSRYASTKGSCTRRTAPADSRKPTVSPGWAPDVLIVDAEGADGLIVGGMLQLAGYDIGPLTAAELAAPIDGSSKPVGKSVVPPVARVDPSHRSDAPQPGLRRLPFVIIFEGWSMRKDGAEGSDAPAGAPPASSEAAAAAAGSAHGTRTAREDIGGDMALMDILEVRAGYKCFSVSTVDIACVLPAFAPFDPAKEDAAAAGTAAVQA